MGMNLNIANSVQATYILLPVNVIFVAMKMEVKGAALKPVMCIKVDRT